MIFHKVNKMAKKTDKMDKMKMNKANNRMFNQLKRLREVQLLKNQNANNNDIFIMQKNQSIVILFYLNYEIKNN